MATNFDVSLKYVLLDEGGNSDDPQDHGGRTSRGITQREYDAWCNLNGKPDGDVWAATGEEVKSIYYSQYWEPYCGALPAGLDYLFFDMSVNAGRTQAVRTFQKALNVNVDGMMGQVTQSAILAQGTSDTSGLIKRISDVRRAFYRHLNQFPRYGKGWLNRVQHSENAALALAANQAHDKPAAQSSKATAPVQPIVSPELSGTATGGIIATLEGFKDQLEGLKDSIPHLTYIILGIAGVGFGYTLYSMYLKSKVQQAT